ncbi:Trypsin [Popillia japonica]|uniref:Trypsin n=1 Tax=Popillia japonica TaxID=7064 RepID=A0AAW1MXN9_POPJA
MEAAGRDWLEGFLGRNPEISLRTPEPTTINRLQTTRYGGIAAVLDAMNDFFINACAIYATGSVDNYNKSYQRQNVYVVLKHKTSIMATKLIQICAFIICVFLRNQPAIAEEKLISPCPDILDYETQGDSKNTYYAKLNLDSVGKLPNEKTELKLTLNGPAQQVTSPSGEVQTSDGNIYTLSKMTASSKAIGFLISYNENATTPVVSEIQLNGKTICSDTRTRQARQIFIDGFLRPEQSVLFNYDIDQLLCGVTAEQEYSFFRGQEIFKSVRYPWHAAIFYYDLGKLKYGCGGTLISRQFILTAAHCLQGFARAPLKPTDIQIQLGRYDLNLDSPGSQNHEVSAIYIHPSYSRINYANNLALIRLRNPVQYDDFVRPACLWKGDNTYSNLVGTTGTAVGWGLNENQNFTYKLRDFDLVLGSYKDCQFSDAHAYFQYQSGGLYCAGFQNGTSICQGDAGGGSVKVMPAVVWFSFDQR